MNMGLEQTGSTGAEGLVNWHFTSWNDGGEQIDQGGTRRGR
jgi:hypothetical protein